MTVESKNDGDNRARNRFYPAFPKFCKRSIPMRQNGWVAEANRGPFDGGASPGPVIPDDRRVMHTDMGINLLMWPEAR